jgi:hypothetical protein
MPDDIQDNSGQTLDEQINPMTAQSQPDFNASTTPGPQSPTQAPAMPQAQGSVQQNQNQPRPQVQGQNQPQPPLQQQIHQSMFNKVLEAFSGGPTKYTHTDPQTGQVSQVVQHNPKKAMAASILAGAISGMLAGTQAPANLNKYGQRDLSGAAQAGAQAGQNIVNARNQGAQNLDDKQKQSYLATVDQNMKLHQQHLADTQLEGQNQDAARQRIERAAMDADPIMASMAETYKDLGQKDTSEVMPGDELQNRMAKGDIHVSDKSAFIVGSKPIIGQDGQVTGHMPQYRVYDPSAQVAITKEIQDKYPKFKNAALGQMVPVQAFWQSYNDMQSARTSKAIGTQLEQDFKDAGTPAKEGAFDSVTPILRKYNAAIAGLDPDQIPPALRKLGVAESTINQLTSLYPPGYKAQTFVDKRANDEREQRKQQDEETQKRESAITLQREKDLALFKKSIGVYDSDSVSNTKSFANEWVDPKTKMHYDLSDPVMNMVEGNEDPTQMTKRSKTYNQDLKMANAYSFARYGKPFDLAQAQSDYKYATSVPTQNTIKMLQSLTGEGGKNNAGTLAQLQSQFDALGNTPVPKMNELANWASKNAGNPAVTNFNATLVPVSDEMGKILGGGVATDSSRAEARSILDAAFSQGQGKGAINAIRGAMAQRQNAMLGNNRYLSKQYGKMDMPHVVPQGKIPAYKDGQLIGYADDKQGNGYKQF